MKSNFSGCNWSLDCGGSGIFVDGVDNKKGKNGPDTLQELQKIHENLPPTLTVKTPNGIHLRYKGLGKSTVEKLGPEIDTRGVGGYVVIPGSIRPENEYKNVNDVELACYPSMVA